MPDRAETQHVSCSTCADGPACPAEQHSECSASDFTACWSPRTPRRPIPSGRPAEGTPSSEQVRLSELALVHAATLDRLHEVERREAALERRCAKQLEEIGRLRQGHTCERGGDLGRTR